MYILAYALFLACSDMMTHSRLMLDQNEALEKIKDEIQAKLRQLSASISKMTTTTGDKTAAGFDRDLPYSRFAYSRLSHQISEMRKSFAASVCLLQFFEIIFIYF